MGAAAVVLHAGVVVRQLAQRVVRVDVVRPVSGVAKHSQIAPGELLGPADSLQVPVGPEHEVVEDRDGEDVRHGGPGEDLPSVVTLQVSEGYVVEVGVCPEYPVGEVVDGQGVRPGDVVLPGEDSCEVTAVHSHLAYVSLEIERIIASSATQMDWKRLRRP